MTPSNICVLCKHNQGGGVCKAFPEGIPQEIEHGKHDHRKPFAGDDGVRFEAKK